MMRRLMWVLVAGSFAAIAASCAPCLTGGQDPNQVSLVDGGMGEPCSNNTHCSAGLECQAVFALTDTHVDNEVFLGCTQLCDGTRPCPQGSVCADSAGQPGASGYCVPACQADGDCRTGKRAATCVGFGDAGTSADGGVLGGACQPVVCDGTCPTGFSCQGQRYRGGGCGTGSSGAPAAPPPSSWCGKN